MKVTFKGWEEALVEATSDPRVGIKIGFIGRAGNHSVHVTSLEPDQFVKPHYHHTGVEIYHFAEGDGAVYLQKLNSGVEPERIMVGAGASLIIPPLHIHKLVNTGTKRLVLVFSGLSNHLGTNRAVKDFSP